MPIAFDFETFLFGPGNMAPKAVCLSIYPNRELHHAKGAEPRIVELFGGNDLLVGQNVAYDCQVICANWPHLIPTVFAKYDRNQITCTKIREQLIDTALGRFRGARGLDGEWVQRGYSLDDMASRYLKRRLDKDTWRLKYGELYDVPLDQWPEGARLYPLEDAVATYEVFQCQEQAGVALLVDQFNQTRYQFALALTSCYGLRTDPSRVEEFARLAEEDYTDLKKTLVAAGLVRPDVVNRKGVVVPGAADTKAAQAAMARACEAEGIQPVLTKGGQISLGADACDRVDDPIIQDYSEFQTARKVLSNDVEMLKGALQICHPRYDLTKTGRTTCAGPNIQALRKKAGIRDCFMPEEGNVYIQCDYPSLELYTRAEWCIRVLGSSSLAATLNAGMDAHLSVAAVMLGITYEEALRRKKDKDVKEARQAAKPINFGVPGGLGIARTCDYSKKQYGVDMTPEQAKTWIRDWKRAQPEVEPFFRLAAELTAETGTGGEISPFTGQITSGKKYSELCNERFQRLGADIAKMAMWYVARECFTGSMIGWHPVAFIHDEIICEGPAEDAARAAGLLAKLMKDAANVYLQNVPMHDEKDWPLKLEPLIMTCWAKEADPTYNEQGVLIPWEPTIK